MILGFLTILGLVFGVAVGLIFKGHYLYLEAIGTIYSHLILAIVIPLLLFSIISSITNLGTSIKLKKNKCQSDNIFIIKHPTS